MNETFDVTVVDVVQWLHDEGLIRLAGLAGRQSNPVAAYAVDIATGTVTAYQVSASGTSSHALTVVADELPDPEGTAERLVVVGVTVAESVLVVDLSIANVMAINGDRPEFAARAWALQLLLNPEVTITTNSAQLAIADEPRFRHTFIPGGGTTVTVDDTRPPVATIAFNPVDDRPDRLDLAADGTGEMYVGTRFWALRRALRVDDDTWTALAADMATPPDAEYAVEGD
ncbi:MAG: hypothetical protein JWN03_8474 [Nocardia sp.]|uniref:hypothetical protein n=1 Tax=Nocardia sp. TaxID=1821 RepID=UPI002636FE88|nr:hypothetical protein [Nocardia sp.]MCU1648199.1 hypothetical protein [Nocardia sp.]